MRYLAIALAALLIGCATAPKPVAEPPKTIGEKTEDTVKKEATRIWKEATENTLNFIGGIL